MEEITVTLSRPQEELFHGGGRRVGVLAATMKITGINIFITILIIVS